MVIVAGAAQTPYNRRKDNSSFRDWAAGAFTAALAMSGLEATDIDLLVVASESDFFTLQLNPASVLASDLGLVGVAAMRVEGGGASGQLAVHAGVHAILAGQAARVAVVGVDPSASQLSGDAIRTLYGYSFDAWSDGMTGVTATVLYALSWQVYAEESGLDERHLGAVTIQNRANAMKNDKAHLGRLHTADEIERSAAIASPYRRLHCSPLSDGAAAMILCGADAVPAERRSAPRICGTGAATDTLHLGSRPQKGRFEAKTAAMKRACKQAGIGPDDIGLAEVYDSYAGAQLQALDCLGLATDIGRELQDGRFAPDGGLPVNLSGGLMGLGAPVGAIGVGQTANCALFLEGRNKGTIQPKSPPAYALADTHGGICTTAAVTLLAQGDAA